METKKPIQKKATEKPVAKPAAAVVKEKPIQKSDGLTIVIRIKGDVKVKPQIRETLYRLRLRRKYAAVLIDMNKKELKNMVDKVKHSTAFGTIDKDTLVKLLETRAQPIDSKKINAAGVADELIKGKKLEELGLKPFFRLHPPRGGIDSKIQFNNGGVLGNNKAEINKLVERML